MRIPVFAFFLFAAAGLATAAGETSLSGKWQIERNAGGNQSRQDCTITQKDNDLTGSCSSDRGPVEIKGKVDGKNVTFTYKGDSAGGPVTVVYKGTIDSADKMSGTVTAVEFLNRRRVRGY
ncbi:MAG TPA: hypothetical protein VNV86_05205 [Candidatus Acidoferrum sp.]|jgi:hypothetical protein|nr:hypothetical protein [Candidatus Acidoferrum sp.]